MCHILTTSEQVYLITSYVFIVGSFRETFVFLRQPVKAQ